MKIYTYTCSSFIYNCQNLKPAKISFPKQMVNQATETDIPETNTQQPKE